VTSPQRDERRLGRWVIAGAAACGGAGSTYLAASVKICERSEQCRWDETFGLAAAAIVVPFLGALALALRGRSGDALAGAALLVISLIALTGWLTAYFFGISKY